MFPIMTGVLYNIIPISPDQHNGVAKDTYGCSLPPFVNAIYTVYSDYMIGIDLFQVEI